MTLRSTTLDAKSPGPQSLRLEDGSRVAVIGSGPAGSLFSYFLLQMTERLGTTIEVDLYEPRTFAQPGPQGCNMCCGIISESLVQLLAAEGVNLPGQVVQRGVDTYRLHMDVGSVSIKAGLREKRIAAVHRGPGPRGGVPTMRWGSFDGHLLQPRHSAANHLYRIAQEAVNNALKHGKASRIRIKLAGTPDRVILGIRDNGRGIRRNAGRAGGMGLHIMHFRADAIRGSLAVQRHPEGGTEVVCSVSRRGLLPQPENHL